MAPSVVTVDLPILASMLIALSAVLSLVTIVSIYREGGILKRLRATPLRPYTILSAHVIVKLMLTAVTFGATMLIGRRYYPLDGDVPADGVHAGADVHHREHPVDRVPDCQRRPHGALRAADWLDHPVPDAGAVGAVHADRHAAARCCRRPRACCRSPTPSRCCGASGTATDGWRTAAMWLCWRWCLWRARRCRPRCFGGSNVSCAAANDPQMTRIHGIPGR